VAGEAGRARDAEAGGPAPVRGAGRMGKGEASAGDTRPGRSGRSSHPAARQATQQAGVAPTRPAPDAPRPAGRRAFAAGSPSRPANPKQRTALPQRSGRTPQESSPQESGRPAPAPRPGAARRAAPVDAPARQAGTPPSGTPASASPRRAARSAAIPSAAIASDVAGADATVPDAAPPDAARPGARASGPDAPKGPGALRRSRPVRQTRSHAAPPPAARPPAAAPGPDTPPGERGERIAKWLARAGVASRRDAEKLLAEGRVRMNNAVITHPATFVTAGDLVQVNGALVEAPGRARLWRYHKPDGLVTTHRDPEGRDTVFAALPPGMGRVVSVGRLDLNSEGLLLLTNDGGLARRLEMPANGWLRRYRVRVYGVVDEAALAGLASGIEIDGVRYGPIEAGLDSRKGNNGWVTVALREGRNREVRRVMEHLGLRVTRLIRVAYGPFQLGLLTRGSVEEVTAKVLREQIPDL